jgi:hypothetical protein
MLMVLIFPFWLLLTTIFQLHYLNYSLTYLDKHDKCLCINIVVFFLKSVFVNNCLCLQNCLQVDFTFAIYRWTKKSHHHHPRYQSHIEEDLNSQSIIHPLFRCHRRKYEQQITRRETRNKFVWILWSLAYYVRFIDCMNII